MRKKMPEINYIILNQVFRFFFMKVAYTHIYIISDAIEIFELTTQAHQVNGRTTRSIPWRLKR